jgi:hypothetical protein
MGEGVLPEVSQPVGGVYIVVAGVYIAVMFHDGDTATFGLENAKGVSLVKGGAQGLLKNLDIDLPDVVFRPFVEDFSQEAAKSLCRHGVGRYSCRRPGFPLHQRQEGEVPGSQLPEKAVKVERMTDIDRIYHT